MKTVTSFMFDIVKVTRNHDSVVGIATRLDNQEFESQQRQEIGYFCSPECPD
jgi:hypothetical protein